MFACVRMCVGGFFSIFICPVSLRCSWIHDLLSVTLQPLPINENCTLDKAPTFRIYVCRISNECTRTVYWIFIKWKSQHGKKVIAVHVPLSHAVYTTGARPDSSDNILFIDAKVALPHFSRPCVALENAWCYTELYALHVVFHHYQADEPLFLPLFFTLFSDLWALLKLPITLFA